MIIQFQSNKQCKAYPIENRLWQLSGMVLSSLPCAIVAYYFLFKVPIAAIAYFIVSLFVVYDFFPVRAESMDVNTYDKKGTTIFDLERDAIKVSVLRRFRFFDYFFTASFGDGAEFVSTKKTQDWLIPKKTIHSMVYHEKASILTVCVASNHTDALMDIHFIVPQEVFSVMEQELMKNAYPYRIDSNTKGE